MKNDSNASVPASASLDNAQKPASLATAEAASETESTPTYTEIAQLFQMIVKPSGCDAIKDKETGEPTGSFSLKWWGNQRIKDGEEVVINKVIIRGLSDQPLAVGIEHLCEVALDFDCKVIPKKTGGFFLANKEVTRVRIVSVLKKLK